MRRPDWLDPRRGGAVDEGGVMVSIFTWGLMIALGGFYLFVFIVASLTGRSCLMSECHGTAPSACTVLSMVSPLRGDL